MKRELKFRAWDNDYHKMVQSIVCETFELGISFEGVVIGFSQENSTKDKPAEVGIFPARFTPMQFTGLKDKMEKEIYEGDILKDEYNRILLVEWWGYAFTLKAITKTTFVRAMYIIQWFEDQRYIPEIIGNIYETPDLLEA